MITIFTISHSLNGKCQMLVRYILQCNKIYKVFCSRYFVVKQSKRKYQKNNDNNININKGKQIHTDLSPST